MKISLIAIIVSLVSISASAQIERKPVARTDSSQAINADGKADKQSRKDRMRELDLTKEQKSKMKELRLSGKAAKDAIENNAQLTDAEKKKQSRELQKTQLAKMQAILTPEQFEKFKASRQNNP